MPHAPQPPCRPHCLNRPLHNPSRHLRSRACLSESAQARLWQGFRLVGSRDSIYGNLAVTRNRPSAASTTTAPPSQRARRSRRRGGRSLRAAGASRAQKTSSSSAAASTAASSGAQASHRRAHRLRRARPRTHLHRPAVLSRPVVPTPTRACTSTSADGRSLSQNHSDAFDAILLNVPDPQTAQLNRFYTVEFFRSARAHLAPGGLLALQLRSSEETIEPQPGRVPALHPAHPQGGLPLRRRHPRRHHPLLRRHRPNVLTTDPKILIARLHQRNLHTQYVREYFIPYRMMPDRMAQVQQQLQPLASTPVNRDFAPIAYYFDVVLWSAQFKSGYSNWFRPPRTPLPASSPPLLILLTGCPLAQNCHDSAGVWLEESPLFPARPFRRRLLRRRNRLHAHRPRNLPAARLPIHLRLRLPPARNPHRPLHGGHRPRKLARPAPHSALGNFRPSTMAITQLLLALSCPALLLAEPARKLHRMAQPPGGSPIGSPGL
jgi:hypothetical protein